MIWCAEFLETELSDKLIASYRDDLDFQVPGTLSIVHLKLFFRSPVPPVFSIALCLNSGGFLDPDPDAARQKCSVVYPDPVGSIYNFGGSVSASGGGAPPPRPDDRGSPGGRT